MKSLWVPIIACILVLTLIGFCAEAKAFCELGSDGNWHSDEDPFVDAENHDFRLKPGSCAIGHGADIPEVTHDIVGTKRPKGNYDIGAYQSVSTRPVAPDNLRIIQGR